MPVRIGERYKERYEVIAHIGEGAFAHVFRVRDVSSGQDRALKILKEEYSDTSDVVERFQREVFAIASIQSPHVVTMVDFGFAEAEHEFFLVMEFVEGPTLRTLLGSHTPWSPEETTVVLGQVAHALMAAHRSEIIHRDLKPENIILVERNASWVAKVLDFGFAKLAELERTLELSPITRVGFCFGTPQYLSPEQIRGRAIDGRTDLFALGVMAYEMLTGRRPWDGKDPREVMMAVLKTAPPPAAPLHPSLQARHHELERFFLRVLGKEREERPADAGAFFELLQQALFQSPTGARRALAGAQPTQPLEDVTSRSIPIRIAEPTRDRFDATEIDLAQATERLDSQYLPPVDREPARDEESGKSTLPRGAPQLDNASSAQYRIDRPFRPGIVTFVLVALILLAAAFLLGRYSRF